MTNVVFVHGTGVRRKVYEQAFQIISSELKRIDNTIDLQSCLWGETEGAKLNCDGKSIPTYDSARGIADAQPATAENYRIALWSQLYQDPLFELCVISSGDNATADNIFNKTADEIAQRLDSFKDKNEPILSKLGVVKEYVFSREQLIESEPFKDACTRDIANSSDFAAVIARCVVAGIIKQCDEEDLFTSLQYDQKTRDELVDAILNQLTGDRRGLLDTALKPVVPILETLATSQIKRKRGAVSDGAYPCTADILMYQARGEGIRKFIANSISECKGPVIVIGHSLGGIAAADLLISASHPQVEAFITVGSQVTLFYETNSLSSLPCGEQLPKHFPKWVNFYDLRDFLSYVGEPIFKDRVKDIRVDNKQSFPRAHGAYWTNQQFWQELGSVLKSFTLQKLGSPTD